MTDKHQLTREERAEFEAANAPYRKPITLAPAIAGERERAPCGVAHRIDELEWAGCAACAWRAYHDALGRVAALEADAEALRLLNRHRELWYHIRPAFNRVGVAVGGFLVCKQLDGPEMNAATLTEAVNLACDALGIRERPPLTENSHE